MSEILQVPRTGKVREASAELVRNAAAIGIRLDDADLVPLAPVISGFVGGLNSQADLIDNLGKHIDYLQGTLVGIDTRVEDAVYGALDGAASRVAKAVT